MPEPDKPIKRMNTVNRRIWFVRERARQRRAEREAAMAEDTKSEKVPATAEQKRAMWKRVLWIIGIALAVFGGEKLRPVAKLVETVGPAAVDELIPLPTATPLPSPTPAQVGTLPDIIRYKGDVWVMSPGGDYVPEHSVIQPEPTPAQVGWRKTDDPHVWAKYSYDNQPYVWLIDNSVNPWHSGALVRVVEQ